MGARSGTLALSKLDLDNARFGNELMADWLTAEQRSRNMAAIRSRGTKPELMMAEMLASLFPRRKVIEHPDLPGRPDFLLPGLKLAVFADGCFWHGCPKHGRRPEDNRDYWGPKLDRNRKRDRQSVRKLRAAGLKAVRVWEHELREETLARRKLRRAASAP